MNIVICYDGTKPAKASIDVGVQICRAFNATAHIVMSVIVEDDEKFEFTEDDSSKDQKILKKANTILTESFEQMKEAQIDFKTHLLNRGLAPGEDIVSFAKKISADFIIIGIRQRSRVGKFLLGSAAQYVVLKAHCPVITIPPQAKERYR